MRHATMMSEPEGWKYITDTETKKNSLWTDAEINGLLALCGVEVRGFCTGGSSCSHAGKPCHVVNGTFVVTAVTFADTVRW